MVQKRGAPAERISYSEVGLSDALPAQPDTDERLPEAGRFYVAPGRSALAHWRILVVTTVSCIVIGLVAGYLRPPKYTSTSTLYVGQTLSLGNTAAIAGLASAAATIAQDYARLISTSSVVKGTEKILKVHDLPGTLSATEIAETPEILVSATASSPQTAIALANAGSKALINSVTSISQYNTQVLNQLKASYASLESQIATTNSKISSLQNQVSSGASDTSSLEKQISDLRRQVSGWTLQANSVAAQYADQYSPYTAEESVLQRQSPAGYATSNRKTSVEIGLVGGLAVGVIFGVVAASFLDIRRDRVVAARRAGGLAASGGGLPEGDEEPSATSQRLPAKSPRI